jgi:hypothetical protein
MDKALNINSANPTPIPPMVKSRAQIIERSLLLFNISWLGLIPLLGIAPALIALRLHFKVRKEVNYGWNPARRYEYIGAIVSYLCLVLSLVMWVFAILYLIQKGVF